MSFQFYANTYFKSQKYNQNYLQEMIDALNAKVSYSWIRIGDGELVFLQQEYIKPISEIKRTIGWSNSEGYCGAKVPNIDLRDRLIEAIKNSNLVGMFHGDPPTMQVFEKIGMFPKSINYAFENVFLPMNAKFVNMLLNKKILLVGRDSAKYAKKFKEILNIDTVANIPINGYNQIGQTMKEMEKYDYDLALVSAGVNAKIICYEMSKKFSKMYLDMGHAWDNAFHPPGMYDEYFLIPVYKDKYYASNEIAIYNNKLYKNMSEHTINSVPDQDSRWVVIEDNL